MTHLFCVKIDMSTSSKQTALSNLRTCSQVKSMTTELPCVWIYYAVKFPFIHSITIYWVSSFDIHVLYDRHSTEIGWSIKKNVFSRV